MKNGESRFDLDEENTIQEGPNILVMSDNSISQFDK